MHGIQNALFSSAATLCVFSAGVLRAPTCQSASTPRYFQAFLLTEALRFCCELLISHPAAPLKALWLALLMASSLLVAPCLWLAIQESVRPVRPGLLALSLGQRLLIAAGTAATWPLLQTAHLGAEYVNPERPVGQLDGYIIHAGMLLCIALFSVQVPWYVVACRRVLAQAAADVGHGGAVIVRGPPAAWSRTALVIVVTTWLLALLRTLHCVLAPRQEALILLFCLVDVGVTIGALYLTVRSAPGAGPRELAATRTPQIGPGHDPTPTAKYLKSSLDPAARARIRHKLEQAMAGEERFRDSLLSLDSLSRGIKENAHAVSQVMNQELGASFYEYVNRHRIDKARQLLVTCPERNVLEVALAVGFNSKSTFHAAFRRLTGVTPGQYRQSEEPPASEP